MWRKLKAAFGWMRERITWKIIRRSACVLAIFIFFYYLVGMVVVQNIDDDLAFASDKLAARSGKSGAVTMAVALIDREVNTHAWISNDPWFKPGAMLDNMAHYQQGIVAASAIFAIELKDQLSRRRGSSQVDEDLPAVASGLNYAPDRWFWDPSVSLFFFVAPAEQQYNNALKHLKRYNDRLAGGEAVFETRPDNLLSTLEKIALDVGSSSDSIAREIDQGFGCVLDTGADDLFYHVKGRVYAYGLLLKGLRADFEGVVTDRDIGGSWDRLEESLAALLALDPVIVTNCSADGFLFQNHLTAQGFYLLRARTQLKEINNILLK